MSIDGILLHACREALQEILPARISRIHNVSDTEILFQLRSASGKRQLLVSAHSSYNRILLTDRRYPTPETPSNFVMTLRKYLDSGWILSIEQTGLDRCLVLTVRSLSEAGDTALYRLYVELMGKYANVILVSPAGRILHALKLIPPYENTRRIIQIGAPFHLTDPLPGKTDPFQAERIDPSRSLVEQFEGFSPLLEKEVRWRMAQGEPFARIMEQLASSRTLYIYPGEGGIPPFHLIPLTHLERQGEQLPLFEGLDQVYFTREEHDRIRQQTGDLYKITRREIKKLSAKIIKLKDALEAAENCDPWKEKGQLLYANADRVHKGMTSITLDSFETGKPVRIELDPRLDARGNAAKCFHKYTKGKSGQVYIREQLDKAGRELEYFKGLEYQLSSADFIDAGEIKQDLILSGYLPAPKMTPRRRGKKEEAPHYKSFSLPDGALILYGKNNLQNEYLTWKKASKSDLWFHVKDAPGSHLVLIQKDPSEQDIRTAAMCAAYHSSLKDSSSIPVNWCPVRNLKKIPGAKKGMVELGAYRTIYIDIDPSQLKEDPEGPDHDSFSGCADISRRKSE